MMMQPPERAYRYPSIIGACALVILVLASVPALTYAWLCIGLADLGPSSVWLLLGTSPALLVIAGGVSLGLRRPKLALTLALLACAVGFYFLQGELSAMARED